MWQCGKCYENLRSVPRNCSREKFPCLGLKFLLTLIELFFCFAFVSFLSFPFIWTHGEAILFGTFLPQFLTSVIRRLNRWIKHQPTGNFVCGMPLFLSFSGHGEGVGVRELQFDCVKIFIRTASGSNKCPIIRKFGISIYSG